MSQLCVSELCSSSACGAPLTHLAHSAIRTADHLLCLRRSRMSGLHTPLQPPRSLPCLLDAHTLLPSPHRRPFARRAGHRIARTSQTAQADKRDSYVLVDPVPPSPHEDSPVSGNAVLLGYAQPTAVAADLCIESHCPCLSLPACSLLAIQKAMHAQHAVAVHCLGMWV